MRRSALLAVGVAVVLAGGVVVLAAPDPLPSSPARSRAVAVPAELLNPAVTQQSIDVTICVPGWTATVRPSTSVTGPIEVRQIQAYGYEVTDPGHYELDHVINLGLGGAPSAEANLWPFPYPEATASDTVEQRTQRRVCKGELTLRQGREAIFGTKLSAGYRRHLSVP